MCGKQENLVVNANSENECLTKELDDLKLRHQIHLEDHKELLKTHESLCFEMLNLMQEHEWLKATNDDLQKRVPLILSNNYCLLSHHK